MRPFRLGTTSYILPDEIIPNVEFLGPRVDDIELVLFESDELSNLPDPRTVGRLRELAATHGLTYTVHLPLDADLGDVEEAARRRSVAKCERVIDRLAPVSPVAYLVHFHEDLSPAPAPRPAPEWLAALRRSMEDLLERVADPELLCVETLSYPFGWVDAIVAEMGASICLDVGHVLLAGERVEAYLDRYLPRTRVVHLHGLREGQDHRDLGGLPEGLLSLLLTRLASDPLPERVVTLEVFNRADFEASLAILEGR
ncbi:MAG: sugar phosphate isomerase/epimerase [Armatimonadetes bacterium]|nr:sugar phosphate isomerase/epimerase [Armatimonadota bacterium]